MRKLMILGSLLLVLSVLSLSSCQLVAGQLLAQFTLEIEPSEVTIAAGTSENVTVSIQPIAGISLSSVSVKLIKRPVGVEADDIVVLGERDWEIRVSGTVQPGEYTLEVQAISQGLNLIPVEEKEELTLIVPD